MPSITNNFLVRYAKESVSELRQVTWPTRQTILMHTALVIGISAVVAMILGGLDFVFSYGLEQLIVALS